MPAPNEVALNRKDPPSIMRDREKQKSHVAEVPTLCSETCHEQFKISSSVPSSSSAPRACSDPLKSSGAFPDAGFPQPNAPTKSLTAADVHLQPSSMTVSGVLLKYVLIPYLASIALLYILSWILPPNARRLPSFFARILASIGCLGLAASYGLLSAMLLRLVGKEGLTQWTVAKCFKYLMLLTTGVGVEVVEGAEYLNTRPAVYLGNHQSYVYFFLIWVGEAGDGRRESHWDNG